MLKVPTAVNQQQHHAAKSNSTSPRSDTFQLSESFGDHFALDNASIVNPNNQIKINKLNQCLDMAAVRVFGYDRTNNIDDLSKDISLEASKEDCAKAHFPIVLPTALAVPNRQIDKKEADDEAIVIPNQTKLILASKVAPQPEELEAEEDSACDLDLEFHKLQDVSKSLHAHLQKIDLKQGDLQKGNTESLDLKQLQMKVKVDQVNQLFKERISKMHQGMDKNFASNDRRALHDCQAVVEYAKPILHNMRESDRDYTLPPDFLKVAQQSHLKATNRAFLIEWIIDVHRKFRLLPETLYTAVSLIDRFLAQQEIHKKQLQMLGVVALLISSKYEEIYPPEIRDLQIVSEGRFSRGEILYWEVEVLNVVKFDVGITSQYFFLERYRKLTTMCDDQVFFLAQYLQEIALLDSSMLQFRPSEMAAAALILSARALKKEAPIWNEKMQDLTGLSAKQLEPVTTELQYMVEDINPKFLHSLKYKFQKEKFGQVTKIPFEF